MELLLLIACLTEYCLETPFKSRRKGLNKPLADVYITESKLPAAEIAIMTSQAC
jgi:hypothetical protein